VEFSRSGDGSKLSRNCQDCENRWGQTGQQNEDISRECLSQVSDLGHWWHYVRLLRTKRRPLTWVIDDITSGCWERSGVHSHGSLMTLREAVENEAASTHMGHWWHYVRLLRTKRRPLTWVIDDITWGCWERSGVHSQLLTVLLTGPNHTQLQAWN